MASNQNIRIGLGIDSHRIEVGGPLILGGLRLEMYPMHLVGHSDADVLLHAITDAVLTAAGLPDIGELFPNTLDENKGRDSAEMLELAMTAFRKKGWRLLQIESVVELERPKISSHKEEMRRRIASIVGIDFENVHIKGKTGEGVGEIGTGQLARATCIVLAERDSLQGSNCQKSKLDDAPFLSMGREVLKSFGAPYEITESLDDFRYEPNDDFRQEPNHGFRYEPNHVYRVDDALRGYIERAFGSHPWRG